MDLWKNLSVLKIRLGSSLARLQNPGIPKSDWLFRRLKPNLAGGEDICLELVYIVERALVFEIALLQINMQTSN